MAGGGAGAAAPRPELFSGDVAYTYFCMGVLALMLVFDWRLLVSRPGRAIQALRDDEGNEHPLTVPTGVFATSDGHINLAAIGQTMWKRLCEALDAPQLVHEPDFASDAQRVQQRERLGA